MNSRRPSKLLGVAAVVFGGCWIGFVLARPVANFAFTTVKELIDDIALFAFLTIFALPGILAVYFGLRLLRGNDPRDIKGAVGCFAVYAVIWLSSLLSRFLPFQLNQSVSATLSILLATLVVIPPYLLLASFFLRQEGLAPVGLRHVIGKGMIYILALLIWSLASALAKAYSPVKEGIEHVPVGAWELIRLIVPIVLAWGFYRLAVGLLALNKAADRDVKTPATIPS